MHKIFNKYKFELQKITFFGKIETRAMLSKKVSLNRRKKLEILNLKTKKSKFLVIIEHATECYTFSIEILCYGFFNQNLLKFNG